MDQERLEKQIKNITGIIQQTFEKILLQTLFQWFQ
jgi:hypothetical protein